MFIPTTQAFFDCHLTRRLLSANVSHPYSDQF